jgi:methylenetetrahydrofolate dehydrogenase (NADP+)/methenyltetrahydrofolate cyclohydrolase
MRVDGRTIAQNIFKDLKKQIASLASKHIKPHLAIILVGNDPASEAYVRQKKIKGEEIGIRVSIYHYKQDISTVKLAQTIQRLNKDNKVHGIIIQQPLPSHIDMQKLVLATDPAKDVDGFHPQSTFTPPIAEAVITILKNIQKLQLEGVSLNEWMRNKKIIVIGKGETGGAPVIKMLKKIDVNPIIIDSSTLNPERITQEADIIISCVGKANIITKDNIKPGVILISIGMFRGEDGKLHGDYEEQEVKGIASYYTPVPGGVGPVNVAMLLKNVLLAASTQLG